MVSACCFVAVAVAMQVPAEAPTDGAELLEVTKTQFSQIRELEFDFQGKVEPQTTEYHGKASYLAGHYQFSDGTERIDYRVTVEGSPDASISDSFDGAIQKTVTRTNDGVAHAGFVKRSATGESNAPGLPGRLIHLNSFRDYERQIRGSYRSGGWEEFGGHRCLKFSFDQFSGPTPESTVTQTFWLDLDRGGHPIRWQFARGGKVQLELHDVEIVGFPTGDGAQAWIPVSGKVTSFYLPDGKGSGTLGTKPVVVEKISIAGQSVRVNQGQQAGKLDVEFGEGLVVRDSVSKSLYRVGRGERVAPLGDMSASEAGEVMDDTIANANQQAGGITARPRRPPMWWAVVWGSCIAVIGVIVGGYYYVRRRA